MLYRDNVREDGRVMGPHELVYEDYILDTITGTITCGNKTISIKLDENPISFKMYKGFPVTVRYPTYYKKYTRNDSKIIDHHSDIYIYWKS